MILIVASTGVQYCTWFFFSHQTGVVNNYPTYYADGNDTAGTIPSTDDKKNYAIDRGGYVYSYIDTPTAGQ